MNGLEITSKKERPHASHDVAFQPDVQIRHDPQHRDPHGEEAQAEGDCQPELKVTTHLQVPDGWKRREEDGEVDEDGEDGDGEESGELVVAADVANVFVPVVGEGEAVEEGGEGRDDGPGDEHGEEEPGFGD